MTIVLLSLVHSPLTPAGGLSFLYLFIKINSFKTTLIDQSNTTVFQIKSYMFQSRDRQLSGKHIVIKKQTNAIVQYSNIFSAGFHIFKIIFILQQKL